MPFRVLALVIAAIVAVTAANVRAGEFSLQGLGDLPGGPFASYPQGISADGATVVGYSGGSAFRWNKLTGIISLGTPDDHSHPGASSVSGDGAVIAGTMVTIENPHQVAFRWTVETGFTTLGILPTGEVPFYGKISDDGETIVGLAAHPASNPTTAFWWRADDGLLQLAAPAGWTESFAEDVSGNGSTTVGGVFEGFQDPRAARWNADGEVDLLPLPGGGYARAVSADGSFIVGDADLGTGWEAFRWSEQTGALGLGDLRGILRVSPTAISADGRTVVGISSTSGSNEATIWTQASGMLSVRELLARQDEQLVANWTMRAATDISSDGRSLVGFGANPDGNIEGWIVELPLPGDATFNDVVDAADYTLWADNYLSTDAKWVMGDFNFDRRNDGADYTLWADNYSPEAAMASAVPEPSTLALAGIGAIALVAFAARRRFAQLA